MNIRVLNLPRDFNEAQLADMFATFGQVRSASLVMDGETKQSKGFGFVEMDNADNAQMSITVLNGSKVGKNKIRVKPVEAKE